MTITPADVRHPEALLVCYKAKLATKQIPQLGCGPVDPKDKGTKIVPKQPGHTPRIGIFVANQLGALRLDSTKECGALHPVGVAVSNEYEAE